MSDLYFPDGHTLDLGSPSIRFENNKRAIVLAKEIAAANRAATPEEQMTLSKYVGWGDARLANRARELNAILTEEKLRLAISAANRFETTHDANVTRCRTERYEGLFPKCRKGTKTPGENDQGRSTEAA